ncbi:hypothetical protein BDV06DRAFT_171070 [Aspergillus oleicola]
MTPATSDKAASSTSSTYLLCQPRRTHLRDHSARPIIQRHRHKLFPAQQQSIIVQKYKLLIAYAIKERLYVTPGDAKFSRQSEPLSSLASIEVLCQAGSTRLRNWVQQNCRPDCAITARFEFESRYPAVAVCVACGVSIVG